MKFHFFKVLDMNDFAKRLTQLRKKRKLTQIELANQLDIQPRLIGRWEQGGGKPQFDYIIKLAEVLEVSIDSLLIGHKQPHETHCFDITNKKLKDLCKKVDALSNENQEAICHIMDMAVRNEKIKEVISG